MDSTILLISLAVLVVCDIMLIAFLSWITIFIMEHNIHERIQRAIRKLLKVILNLQWGHYWRKIKALSFILLWVLIFVLVFFGIMYVHWQNPVIDECMSKQISYWVYVWNFLSNNSLLVSLIASFIGLFLVFVALQPRLSLSDKLVLSNNGLLRVGITNCHLFAKLIDIQVEMVFIRWDKQAHDERTHVIPMNRSEISVIYGLCRGISQSNYIVHTESGFVWNEKYDAIRCRVIATNSISNLKCVFEKRYSGAQVVRGAFVAGQIVEEKYRYPLRDSKIWNSEIKLRCEKLWQLSDSIHSVVRPIRLTNEEVVEILEKIDRSLIFLQDEEMKKLFPSFVKNADTINEITKKLGELLVFYTGTKNLNPQHKEARKQICEKINKYFTYLADEVNRDIYDLYKAQRKV